MVVRDRFEGNQQTAKQDKFLVVKANSKPLYEGSVYLHEESTY